MLNRLFQGPRDLAEIRFEGSRTGFWSLPGRNASKRPKTLFITGAFPVLLFSMQKAKFPLQRFFHSRIDNVGPKLSKSQVLQEMSGRTVVMGGSGVKRKGESLLTRLFTFLLITIETYELNPERHKLNSKVERGQVNLNNMSNFRLLYSNNKGNRKNWEIAGWQKSFSKIISPKLFDVSGGNFHR